MKFNLEDAFICCGNKNKYQKIVLIAILLMWLSVDFISLIFPLLELQPKYECKVNNYFIKCNSDVACMLTPDNVNKVIEYRNIITDFQIDCKKEDVILLGVSYALGILIGSFVASINSDIFGRKPVLIVSGIIFFLATLLLINGPTYIFVLIALFLCGCSCSGGTIISYLYVNEILSKDKRSIYGIMISVFFALGGLMYFFFYQIIKNWIYLPYISMGFDLISLTIIIFYFVESPRYFYSINKFCKSLEVLNEIAAKNYRNEAMDFFIKKNYILFLQGKNHESHFEEINFKIAEFDNSKCSNDFSNGKSTSDEINNSNVKLNQSSDLADNIILLNNSSEFESNGCMDINKISNQEEISLLEKLNLKDIFVFLKEYEKELSIKQINCNTEKKIFDYDQNNFLEKQGISKNQLIKINKQNEHNSKHKNKQTEEKFRYKSNISFNNKRNFALDEEKKEPLIIHEITQNKFSKFEEIKINNKEYNKYFEDDSSHKYPHEFDRTDKKRVSEIFPSQKEIIFNSKFFEKEKISSLKNTENNIFPKKISGYLSLIKYKSIRYEFLICNLVWFTYAFSYYGISFYLKEGNDEVFVDGYIVFTAEVISLIITFFIMNSSKFGRVKTINIMIIGAGFFTFSFYYMKTNNFFYYDKIPLFLSRFTITAINSTMYTYSTEFYPTIIRAKGLGVNIFFARIACCLVPIIIEFMGTRSFILFSVLCFFTSIFTFFLPETLNKELEDEIFEEKIKS